MIVPPARSSVPWCVRTVVPLPEYRLSVEFMDGLNGIVDLHALIWPGEIDLAPDAMYDEIKRNGRWVIE